VVSTRSSQGRASSSFRSAGLVAAIKLSSMFTVCYIWHSDPKPDPKYYLGAIVALAIPIPKVKKGIQK